MKNPAWGGYWGGEDMELIGIVVALFLIYFLANTVLAGFTFIFEWCQHWIDRLDS